MSDWLADAGGVVGRAAEPFPGGADGHPSQPCRRGSPWAGCWCGPAVPGQGRRRNRLSLPLVLPPVVTGYLLLVVLGRHGPLRASCGTGWGLTVVFTWQGAAVAAVMAFPLMVRRPPGLRRGWMAG